MRTGIFRLKRFMLRGQILKYQIKFSIAYKETSFKIPTDLILSMLLLVNYSIHFQNRISITSFYLSIYLDLSFSFPTLKFHVTTFQQISSQIFNTFTAIWNTYISSLKNIKLLQIRYNPPETPKIKHTLFYRRRSPVRLCASMPTHLLQRPLSQ